MLAPVWVGLAFFSPDPLHIAVAVCYTALAATGWCIPAIVITASEVRRPLLRRTYLLADAEHCAVGSGWRAGGVYLGMRDGDRVGLPGVPPAAIPDLNRLIASARLAAAAPDEK